MQRYSFSSRKGLDVTCNPCSKYLMLSIKIWRPDVSRQEWRLPAIFLPYRQCSGKGTVRGIRATFKCRVEIAFRVMSNTMKYTELSVHMWNRYRCPAQNCFFFVLANLLLDLPLTSVNGGNRALITVKCTAHASYTYPSQVYHKSTQVCPPGLANRVARMGSRFGVKFPLSSSFILTLGLCV
jgi:hypothetical protein